MNHRKLQAHTLQLIACCVILFTTSCSPTATPTVVNPDPNTSGRPEANELIVYNWQSYIDPEILSNFENNFNVKIIYETFASAEVLLDDLRAGEKAYDVIFPPDYAVSIMRRENLLAPLNKDNVPNLQNIDPLFVNPLYDPNNRYCAAYQWGTTAIAYNYKATGKDITSWSDIFDPKFKGRVYFVESNRAVLGGVLLYLGYSPNTTNTQEINEARDFLIANKDQAFSFLGDEGQNFLLDGDVDIAIEYNGDIIQVSRENPDIRYVIPEEGALVWTDNMCIPANAEHKELAEKFINYILDPQVGAKLSNYIHYASPNIASLPYIDEDDLNNPIIYPPMDIRSRLFFAVDLGEKVTRFYEDAWNAIITAHMGQ